MNALALVILAFSTLAALAQSPAPKLLLLETLPSGICITWSFPLSSIAAVECWDIHRKSNGVQDKDYTLSPLRPTQSYVNGSADVILKWTDTNVVAGIEYIYSVLGYTLEGELAETPPLKAPAPLTFTVPPQLAPPTLNPLQP